MLPCCHAATLSCCHAAAPHHHATWPRPLSARLTPCPPGETAGATCTDLLMHPYVAAVEVHSAAVGRGPFSQAVQPRTPQTPTGMRGSAGLSGGSAGGGCSCRGGSMGSSSDATPPSRTRPIYSNDVFSSGGRRDGSSGDPASNNTGELYRVAHASRGLAGQPSQPSPDPPAQPRVGYAAPLRRHQPPSGGGPRALEFGVGSPLAVPSPAASRNRNLS